MVLVWRIMDDLPNLPRSTAVDEIKILEMMMRPQKVLKEKERFVALSSLISSTAVGLLQIFL